MRTPSWRADIRLPPWSGLGQGSSLSLPPLIAAAGAAAAESTLEFFTARIPNVNTQAYGRAVARFCRWCEGQGVALGALTAPVVAADMQLLIADPRRRYDALKSQLVTSGSSSKAPRHRLLPLGCHESPTFLPKPSGEDEVGVMYWPAS